MKERRVGSKSYDAVRRELGLVSESEALKVANKSVGSGDGSIV